MSTAPTPATPQQHIPQDQPIKPIRIVSHCTLFYWWPVWAVGFILAFITFMTNERMVLVYRGSELVPKATIQVEGKEPMKDRAAWVLPAGKTEKHTEEVRISPSKNLGVLFSIILLLVIVITNIPLRGLWSVIVLVLLVSISIIFALLEWWTIILEAFTILDIRINFEGYLLISGVLFFFWLVILFFFDRQIYMMFSPGQLRVKQAIGDAETVYDTTGMQIHKQRSDLFRHWILGLGSGDLIVDTAGAQAHHFEFPNVLFIGSKVRQIELMLASKEVVVRQE